MAKNPIQFHLSFNNGAERLQLPVNPESISVSTSHGYTDLDAAQFGEYTVIGQRRQTEFRFSSFFPRDYNATYCAYSPLPKPWNCVHKIQRWMRSGEPLRLTVTGTPINLAVTVRDFTYEPERGGNPGDIYFDLSLREYRFVSYRKLGYADDKTTVTTASVGRADTGEKVSNYTVARGDSLFKISAKSEVYGNGDKWRDIYNANKKLIGANPNMITLGQKLVIPR
ncbi:peptidoglycan-binding protein [Paenibacillus sp. BIHB 4019]|uniref:Peptidoglycan-binding protein n=1 Tax=Paenibacillus sp. BIHB 4019 TaxID=1870819 RepID=A0A1B2DJ25_9BACL|nr:LysM peptidoglycan-binding domain-containing protein [Paenibacillus sp. BIHB 4019]ANY67740.1 peptidoglycan-binding protein [Paenibacillus sp. BIHB 4019]